MGLKSFLKREVFQKRIKKMNLSNIRIEHLRSIGATIGEQCFLFSDNLETTEPYLISIGNNVTIAEGVSFITHDDSAEYYAPRGNLAVGSINIGNNVFIGNGSIILPGVTIADNCIIAAGSVVTKSVLKEKCVIGGVPARLLEDTETLYHKNKDKLIYTLGLSFEQKKKLILDNPDKMIKR